MNTPMSTTAKRKMIANTIELLTSWGITVDDFVAEWRKQTTKADRKP
jgi:hypothetical protein